MDDQVYKTNRWDRYQWGRYVDETDSADQFLKQGEEKMYSFPKFAREVFHRLHADDPQKLKVVRPEDKWALTAHEELSQLPEFDRLRDRCRADRVLAGEAAVSFCQRVFNELPAPKKKLEDPNNLRHEVKGLMEFAKKQKNPELDKKIDELKQEGKEVVQDAVEYSDSIDSSDLRKALRLAIEDANEKVDEQEALIAAYAGWGTGEGTPANVPVEQKAELAKHVARSRKLQTLAREAGRMKRIAAQKQRSKSNYARSEVSDIECGNALDRLLPSEIVKLSDPLLKLDFLRGFCEKSLLQYKLSGQETETKGPIIICIDESGSMTGKKEIWSKAIALALLQIAAKQRRAFRIVHFEYVVTRVDDFEAGKVDQAQLLNTMEHFSGGGTSFEPPLRSALEAIQKKKGLKKADVVFITDGECDVSHEFMLEWAKARAEFGFSVYGVAIQTGFNYREDQVFSKLCTKVVGMADFADDSQVTDSVFSI